MRKTFYISILIIFFNGIVNAQICGELSQYEVSYPNAKVSIEGQPDSVKADFDGVFKLEIPEKTEKVNLIIDLDQEFPNNNFPQLKIIIQNLELTNLLKLDLGKIELPIFKSIGIDEYEQLSESEKESCVASYHWAELNGYYYTNKLENEYLTLNCREKITEFEFNPKTKVITVDWNSIKECE